MYSHTQPIPTSDSMLQIDAEWESKVELQPEKGDYTYAITTEWNQMQHQVNWNREINSIFLEEFDYR